MDECQLLAVQKLIIFLCDINSEWYKLRKKLFLGEILLVPKLVEMNTTEKEKR